MQYIMRVMIAGNWCASVLQLSSQTKTCPHQLRLLVHLVRNRADFPWEGPIRPSVAVELFLRKVAVELRSKVMSLSPLFCGKRKEKKRQEKARKIRVAEEGEVSGRKWLVIPWKCRRIVHTYPMNIHWSIMVCKYSLYSVSSLRKAAKKID
jgi:hypothetical protein